MAALIEGQRDPKVLAQMAKGQLRRKIPVLEEALQGFFTDHHATILAMMLDNVDRLSQQIGTLDQTIESAIAPYAHQVEQLDEITCVSKIGAQELIAELGVDMTRFPSAPQLVSWAKFCPQTHQSAGRSTPKGRGKGNPWLAAALGNIAASASRTDTFLGARYRRIAKRRGVQKAIVATGNTVLTIAWHLLADPEAHYRELGGDYYQRRVDTERRARTLARQLQELTGQEIIIRNGRAVLSDAA
jgi:transposase